jgi:hypothetical protein
MPQLAFIIFISLLLQLLLLPLTNKLACKIPRALAAGLVLLGFLSLALLLIGLVSKSFIPTFSRFVTDFPQLTEQIQNIPWLRESDFLQGQLSDIWSEMKNASTEVLKSSLTLLLSFFSKAIDLVIILFVTFYLLKDGDEKEVDAELLASRIARCFDVDQVLYEPFVYDGQKVSASPLMTSKDFSIVPMEHVEIYAANHNTDLYALIRRYDLRSYCMMNIIDYLVGNTDRHWGNWGFLVDNKTNKPLRLFPLMDFNKAFQAYDAIEGSRCLTSQQPMSQMDAALEAVRRIGLNQKEEIKKEWFGDPTQWAMFQRRYQMLASAAK